MYKICFLFFKKMKKGLASVKIPARGRARARASQEALELPASAAWALGRLHLQNGHRNLSPFFRSFWLYLKEGEKTWREGKILCFL